MKDAMGQAQEWQGQQAAAGATGGMDMGAAVADRDSLQGQAREQNRILSVGGLGHVLIKSHVDTGENVAGNPVWIFDRELTPEGGSAFLGCASAFFLSSLSSSLRTVCIMSFISRNIPTRPPMGVKMANAAYGDTGTLINMAPVSELDLTVTVPGKEPYAVKHRQLIAYSALARFQPGATFSVRVDTARSEQARHRLMRSLIWAGWLMVALGAVTLAGSIAAGSHPFGGAHVGGLRRARAVQGLARPRLGQAARSSGRHPSLRAAGQRHRAQGRGLEARCGRHPHGQAFASRDAAQ